jgi:hypothetical protein
MEISGGEHPKGQWQIIRFGYTSTGVVNHPATPEGLGLEADKMDTTAISVHFNSYAKKLIEAAGNHRGNTFRFILMDSWEAGFQTWTDAFRKNLKTGGDMISFPGYLYYVEKNWKHTTIGSISP